ncbi:MAG: penicillin-binding protein 2 [Candidatus Paceibacteria bacterium]
MSSKDNNPFKISDKSLFSIEEDAEEKMIKEDNMVFEEDTENQVAQKATKNFLNSSFRENKKFYLLLIILVGFLIILSRLFYIQIVNNSFYFAKAEENRERKIPIPAKRGLIYDRQDNKLTENIPRFSLAITPQDLPHTKENRTEVIKKLSQLTDQSTKEIKRIIRKYEEHNLESIVIKENLNYETALSIQISASDLPGIHIQRGSKRLYYLNPIKQNNKKPIKSLSHILGYLGKINSKRFNSLSKNSDYLLSDYIGKAGLEKEYERILRGNYGSKIVEVNAKGERQKVISKTSPKPGKHIKLTLDSKIQQKLEQIIKKYMKKNDKHRAAGIVLDPNSGQIISIVSLPAYNNNHFSGEIEEEKFEKYLNNKNRPLFNRAVAGAYPSGSTIKPVIGAGALQEGIINKNTVVHSTGGIEVSNTFYPDWKEGGHGYTNVTKAIAWSVNTFFYYIGGGYQDFEGLGLSGIRKYLGKFGFGQKTGIDLPNENPGFIPTKKWKRKTKGEQWYIGDTYNLSIGQGDLLTSPLQIANATAAIANKGTLYKPFLVREIIDPMKDEKIVQNKDAIKRNIISDQNMQIIKQGMLECTVYGSCQALRDINFNIAGKTGTAQWSSNNEPHAWFSSFAPYENPEIVLTIIVEEGGDGDEIPISIAEEFYRWWGNYKDND